jgi:ABC-2 type transport system permease protein
VVVAQIFSMPVATSHLGAAVASTVLLALAFGAVATAIGAATGRRALAIAVTSALALAGYLIHALAPLVGLFDRIRSLSPWYHYAAADPLRRGIDPGHAAVLAGIAVVAGVVLPLVFARRDIG